MVGVHSFAGFFCSGLELGARDAVLLDLLLAGFPSFRVRIALAGLTKFAGTVASWRLALRDNSDQVVLACLLDT